MYFQQRITLDFRSLDELDPDRKTMLATGKITHQAIHHSRSWGINPFYIENPHPCYAIVPSPQESPLVMQASTSSFV